jgi:hypothetical protein
MGFPWQCHVETCELAVVAGIVCLFGCRRAVRQTAGMRVGATPISPNFGVFERIHQFSICIKFLVKSVFGSCLQYKKIFLSIMLIT